MMNRFYDVGSVLQVTLLIISQCTLLSLAGTIVFLFKRKSKLGRTFIMCAALLLTVTLHVFMQLDSRITGVDLGPHLQFPYILTFLAVLMMLALNIYILLSETKNRKTIGPRSIQESFDNLPTGVCFFNSEGLPVLCNPAMGRFSFSVCGKDVQYITDLENCLADGFVSACGAVRDGSMFILPDGTAWQLEKRRVEHERGEWYTQYIAVDITDLHRKRMELMRENAQLHKAQAELKTLSANVVAMTREEEILNTKMRIHDEMGRCLIEAQKYLSENGRDIPDSVAISWQRAVSMLKYSNDTPDEDMLLQIRKTCESIKLSFIQTGSLPGEERVAYLLTCAVRECVTNAVRYAEAAELYADFTEDETSASVTVTNNGKPPEKEIVEGGGLSTLRRRVERAGGSMNIRSLPKFILTVTVPKRKEEVL